VIDGVEMDDGSNAHDVGVRHHLAAIVPTVIGHVC
jgi:hypothetical protein